MVVKGGLNIVFKDDKNGYVPLTNFRMFEGKLQQAFGQVGGYANLENIIWKDIPQWDGFELY